MGLVICSMIVGTLSFFTGLAVGAVLTFERFDYAGTLRVDTSFPDEQPSLFLELSEDVGDVRKKKYVILKVNPNSYISQK